jgi:hypothetical protein
MEKIFEDLFGLNFPKKKISKKQIFFFNQLL